MTEFITRSCKAESRYEVIIKTDSEEHYKATEDFARRLIDHAKPKTNADRIRATSDEELADFMTRRNVTESCLRLADEGYMPTEEQKQVIYDSLYPVWMEWLQQPAEGEWRV